MGCSSARVSSDATDAPLLGEAAILFNLTRRAAPGFETKTTSAVPPYVYGFLVFYVGSGGLILALCARDGFRLHRQAPDRK